MLEEQNNARLKILQRKTRNNIEAYKEACRKARKVCRKKKKDDEEGKTGRNTREVQKR